MHAPSVLLQVADQDVVTHFIVNLQQRYIYLCCRLTMKCVMSQIHILDKQLLLMCGKTSTYE